LDNRLARIFTPKQGPQPVPARQEPVWVASIKWSAIAQAVVALGVVLAVCYFGKLVWITLMVSALIAFMLEPLVLFLTRSRIPRGLASLLAVLLLLGAIYAAGYFSYSRVMSFVNEVPRYALRIRGTFTRFERQTKQLEQTRQKIFPTDEQKAVPVSVKDAGSLIERAFSTATEAVMTLGFIPFILYFMLTWHPQAWMKTVRLFPPEHRDQVRDALGSISSMMRTFIVGNFMIGIILSVASMILFAIFRLPYFYFLGFISGFLSLVPYLGAILAAAVPLAAGLGVLNTTEMLIIVAAVIGFHLVGLNVLYPKILGSRLELNPLVVIVGLLVWGWIWGAMGLILAIPIIAAVKIICDHIGSLRPIGDWMGD
jgi:predicted PurR-regulated permease PerM